MLSRNVPTLLTRTRCQRLSTTVAHTKFPDFENKLHPKLVDRIPYTEAKAIQKGTLPITLDGKDILVESHRGTGKVLSFLLPSVTSLRWQKSRTAPKPERGATVLILTSTPERVKQIKAEADALLSGTPHTATALYHGQDFAQEQASLGLTNCDILITTLSRFERHVEKTSLPLILRNLKTLVIDAAHDILDESSKQRVDEILKHLPSERQTLIFGDFFSPVSTENAISLVPPGTPIVAAEPPTIEGVHKYIAVPHAQLYTYLFAIIQNFKTSHDNCAKIAVLLSTVEELEMVDQLARGSRVAGQYFPIYTYHTQLKRADREEQLRQFKDAKSGIMFATSLLSEEGQLGTNDGGVQLFVQLGAPSSPGRMTARLQGYRNTLLIAPEWDQPLLTQLKKASSVGPYLHPSKPIDSSLLERKIAKSMRKDITKRQKSAVYVSFITHYLNQRRALGWTEDTLVETANKYGRDVLDFRKSGHGGVPTVTTETAEKLGQVGLKNTESLRIALSRSQKDALMKASQESYITKARREGKKGKSS